MSDKSSRNVYLPHLRARRQKSGRVYYYFDTGAVAGRKRKEIPLGSDLNEAIAKYSKLKKTDWVPPRGVVTFGDAAKRYMAEVVPTKATATQRGNALEMERLLAYFDNPPAALDSIEPKHVRAYLDARSEAPVRANREKALLSHVFNKAREWGLTKASNPCAGIQTYREKGRKDVYIEDEVYQAVYEEGDKILQGAMDLAYLTAQRSGDLLHISELDIKVDHETRQEELSISQNKTGTKLRFTLFQNNSDASAPPQSLPPTLNSLGKLLADLRDAKKLHTRPTSNLLCDRHGQPLTYNALNNRFEKARARAAAAAEASAARSTDARERQRYLALVESIKAFQFRDLRAKAGTDTAIRTGSMTQAKKQLGHVSEGMTEQYIRSRRGDKVDPTR